MRASRREKPAAHREKPSAHREMLWAALGSDWHHDRMTATGSLFGLAFGDALGAPTEFLPFDTIVLRYGPHGPKDLPDPARVTDDTQMALAVGEAVIEVTGATTGPAGPTAAGAAGSGPVAAARPLAAQPLAEALSRHFVAWAQSPENNRAPGMTCLRACGSLAEGASWREASQLGSKGCGANMRVTPIGLVPGLSPATRAGAAQLQAAVTHGHST